MIYRILKESSYNERVIRKKETTFVNKANKLRKIIYFKEKYMSEMTLLLGPKVNLTFLVRR